MQFAKDLKTFSSRCQANHRVPHFCINGMNQTNPMSVSLSCQSCTLHAMLQGGFSVSVGCLIKGCSIDIENTSIAFPMKLVRFCPSTKHLLLLLYIFFSIKIMFSRVANVAYLKMKHQSFIRY